ncbi:hypothetical protein [Paenibacillus sp. FSL H3-0333]|uniref:hypothetical protein n=1 Tax=Paenibacillus sp. FSL H3-0333 TaxID=2921373 RepID=UPI0030FA6AEA
MFKKYSSHGEATEDLLKSGELKFFGREGVRADGYVYQYLRNGVMQVMVVYEDGRIVVTGG